MSWDRQFWGVEFSSPMSPPGLIGGLWHPAGNPRYAGEPSRALLFKTRKQARAWCSEKMAWCRAREDVCKSWVFRVVRVQEVVRLTPRARDAKPASRKIKKSKKVLRP